jgi:hypothetical protein
MAALAAKQKGDERLLGREFSTSGRDFAADLLQVHQRSIDGSTFYCGCGSLRAGFRTLPVPELTAQLKLMHDLSARPLAA